MHFYFIFILNQTWLSQDTCLRYSKKVSHVNDSVCAFREYFKGLILYGHEAIYFKAAYSVTLNIFRKKKSFLFKSFVKIESSYVFTINMFSTAEDCMEK